MDNTQSTKCNPIVLDLINELLDVFNTDINTKLNAMSLPDGMTLLSMDENENNQHELDTVDYHILMDRINDIIDELKLNINDDHKELERRIFNKLGIEESFCYHDTINQRVKHIIFELQRQHIIQHEIQQQYELPAADSLHFGEPENLKYNTDQSCDIQSLPSYYKQINNILLTEMNVLLINYTKQRLKEECINYQCNIENNNIYRCPCIQRICVFLNIYHQFYEEINAQTITPKMSNCFQMDGYDFCCLQNDFQHIHKIHMMNNHEMQKLICCKLREKYKCISETCNILKRRSRTTGLNRFCLSQSIDQNDHDILWIDKLDRVHSYFLHSSMINGCHVELNEYDENQTDEKQKKQQKCDDSSDSDDDKHDDQESNIPKETQYDGSDDKLWMDNISKIDLNEENKIYKTLVEKVGIFRWQRSTGFTGHNRGALKHLKPKYKNVKEEVLNNSFCTLSMHYWAQTVIKAREFKKSFECEKIRTKQPGRFDDHVFGHKSNWKKGEVPTVKEIIVIKLYTDWDDLQFELKKCFRLEGINDIIAKYTIPIPEKLNLIKSVSEPIHIFPKKISTYQLSTLHLAKSVSLNSSWMENGLFALNLEQHLKEFYHWRGKLLIFIHKFASILESRYYDKTKNKQFEFILYHGINGKMILNPSSTQSFWGPISTTSSYHVAQSFATNKGIILSISSQYPRLKMCNAFDASTISDYPQEQEWLIGHIYLRIRNIYIKSIPKYINMDSKIRLAFFAIHLFREQTFSMDNVLENYIIAFIKIFLFKLRGIDERNYYNNPSIKDVNYKYLKKIIKWHQKYKNDEKHCPMPPGVIQMDKENEMNKNRVFYILIKKFKEFCCIPNRIQTVKIDCISPELKKYFLEEIGENLWNISFKKIINLFPNIEQILFLNWYRFDNDALQNFIHQINKKDNKLKLIKFSYYDYNDPLINYPYFFDPINLNKILIQEIKSLNWKISYPSKQNRKSGYSITLRKIMHT